MFIKEKKLKPLIKKIKKYESKKKSISFDSLEGFNVFEKKKSHESEIDMPVGAIIGCVSVFCGCLLCILPFGITQGTGAAMIFGGAMQVMNAYAEENDKKKLFELEELSTPS